jgi:hypothetical protein
MITAKLFKNGLNQAVRIPKDFEFKGVSEVSIRKEAIASSLSHYVRPGCRMQICRRPMLILCLSDLSCSDI